MFYDLYLELCKEKGVTPTRAAIEIGISKATPTTWKKRGLTPQGETLNKIANYFDVSTDYLLGNVSEPWFYLDNERILREINSYGDEDEKAPTLKDERAITFDDFTYAMQAEAKDLTEMDKQILLSMAKQLNDARKQRNGESE